jgi:cell division protein FtsW (lipid II flippase)
MKWIAVIVLVIIGVLAAIVAVEYLTVSIHSLPSWIPGHHKGNGKFHKRGAVAAVIALAAFVVAGFLSYRFTRGAKPAVAAAPVATGEPSSADQLLSNPPATPGAPSTEE